MFVLGQFPEDYDWAAHDRERLRRRRAIEVRRRALQSYLPVLQRILAGQATPFPPDQHLIAECIRLVFDEVTEDVTDVAELHVRHRDRPEPPAGPA